MSDPYEPPINPPSFFDDYSAADAREDADRERERDAISDARFEAKYGNGSASEE